MTQRSSACRTSAGARSAPPFVVADGIDEAEVLDWCRGRLAKFKVPASVRFVAEVPRNSLGKIQKQGLLEEVR